MSPSVLIEKLEGGGAGVARLPDGRVAFVAGGLPGDAVELTIAKDAGTHVVATVARRLSPGPDRVEPPCALAGRCGGCPWMGLEPRAQRREKGRLLAEALRRLGGVAGLPDELEVETDGCDLGYRSRLRLHVDEAGRAGLHEAGSHRLVPLDACPVAVPALSDALGELVRLAREHGDALGAFREVEISVAERGAAVLVALRPRDPARGLSRRVRALVLALRARWAVCVAGEEGGRLEPLQWRALPGGVELPVLPFGFTQVNWSLNRRVVEAVVDFARARGARRFLDVYAGSGNFALPLLAAGLEGLAVERSLASLRAAAKEAQRAGRRLPIVAGEARKVVGRLHTEHRRFDFAVVDPPRAGARGLAGAVAALGPLHVALVSCVPATLARDLGEWRAAGYGVVQVRAFDFFPHTPHVETLVLLELATQPPT